MTMRLNDMRPAPGSRPEGKRVGRGQGSGLGKTGGRGQKGQRSRSGAGPKAGFEGGQMPLQRRLPKFGFKSRTADFNGQVRLDVLSRMEADVIDVDVLKAAGVVDRRAKVVKVIASGTLDKAVKLKGLRLTKGARAALEAAGGSAED
jgi:large subunit ribosomal protein L15